MQGFVNEVGNEGVGASYSASGRPAHRASGPRLICAAGLPVSSRGPILARMQSNLTALGGQVLKRAMSALKTICVYCGSSNGTDPAMLRAAEQLGRAMAEAGIGLVYGGGNGGLMGATARAVLEKGGHVTGIIPGFLRDRELMLGTTPRRWSSSPTCTPASA